MTPEEIHSLRDALAAYGNGGGTAEDWTPAACRAVFTAAQIELTERQFEAVAPVFRKLPFYGGSYTLDAKRLLKAAKEAL